MLQPGFPVHESQDKHAPSGEGVATTRGSACDGVGTCGSAYKPIGASICGGGPCHDLMTIRTVKAMAALVSMLMGVCRFEF